MAGRIPPEAFAYYASLGPERSHEKVAERYGVTKRGVTKIAIKEKWRKRIAEMEQHVREKAELRAAGTLEEMNGRHLRIAKALQAKALDALRSMPLQSAKDVIRALELGVRQERLVRGEPTERQASVEEVTKREIRSLLVVEDEGDNADENGDKR